MEFNFSFPIWCTGLWCVWNLIYESPGFFCYDDTRKKIEEKQVNLSQVIDDIDECVPGECFKTGFDGFVAQADSCEDRADIFGGSCS